MKGLGLRSVESLRKVVVCTTKYKFNEAFASDVNSSWTASLCKAPMACGTLNPKP